MRGVLTPAPPSDLGYPVTCVDVRSGVQFQYHAQHLFSSGAVDSAWVPDTTHICMGSPEGGAQRIVGDAVGGAFVAWVDDHGLEPDIAIQRLTAQGTVSPGWPSSGVPVCQAINSQYQLDACSDHEGGAYAAWTDFRRGAVPGVFLQRMSDAAAPASGWPAGGLPVSTQISEQVMPSVCGDGSGGAFVGWLDRRSGALAVYGQHMDASGATVAGWPAEGAPIAFPSSHGRITVVGTLLASSGRAFVVWRCEDDTLGVSLCCTWLSLGTAPTPTSLPTVVTLASHASRIGEPGLALAADGSVLVAWADWRTDGQTLRVSRITSSGDLASGFPAGGREMSRSQIGVNAPALLVDGTGDAIIAWEDHASPGGGNIYAGRVLSDGTVDSNWPTGGLAVCTAPGDQSAPALGPDGNGGVVATWIDAGTEAVAGYLSLRRTSVPPPQLVSSRAEPGEVHLVWKVDPSSGASYHGFRRQGEEDWQLLKDLTPDANLQVVLDDLSPPEEQTVEYRLGVDHEGVLIPFAPVEVAVPASPTTLEILRAWGGPSEGGVWVEFALPRGPEAGAELIDIAGRRIASESLAGFGPGIRRALIRPDGRLSAGVYFARIRQGTVVRSQKVVFVH